MDVAYWRHLTDLIGPADDDRCRGQSGRPAFKPLIRLLDPKLTSITVSRHRQPLEFTVMKSGSLSRT
jgi:hypothetical protein